MNAAAQPGVVVVRGELHAVRGRRVRLLDAPPEPRPEVARALRVARMLAVAHRFQRLLDEGAVESQAELAALVGFTPARVSQLMALTTLAPDIQERLLLWTTESGHDPVTERDLRGVVRHLDWRVQRRAFEVVVRGKGVRTRSAA